MPNLTDLADFIKTEVSDEIVTNAYGESRYLSLATAVTGLSNKKFPVLEKPVAGIVTPRGGSKRVSQPETTSLDLAPVEFAVIVPFHKDLLNLDVVDAVEQISRLAQGAIAESVDFTIRNGEDEYGVAAPAGFETYENIQNITVTNKASWISAIKATVADGRSADGAVISSALWLDLAALS